MGKTKCPKCHRSFDDDVKRYVVGSATNTLKVTTHIALKIGLSTICAPFGSTGGRAGSRLGTVIAEKIGCGEEDMKGWWHKCPYCHHQWK